MLKIMLAKSTRAKLTFLSLSVIQNDIPLYVFGGAQVLEPLPPSWNELHSLLFAANVMT